MGAVLYLVCPTDSLEPILDHYSDQAAYYYGSLGNAYSFDAIVLEELKHLITTKHITEISFVLSADNAIVLNTSEQVLVSSSNSWQHLYGQIAAQKTQVQKVWQHSENSFLLLSYYLQSKIKELNNQIKHWAIKLPAINGKIYCKPTHSLKTIYTDLILIKDQQLN